MNTQPDTPHNGNYYVLLAQLPPPETAIVLAPGLSIRRLPCPISGMDLARAGKAGFAGWATLEPFAPFLWAEIESAKDAEVTPGCDTLTRAWLVSALLVLRGFTTLKAIAYSTYSWGSIAGCSKRRSAAESDSTHYHLPPFKGALMDLHYKAMIDTTPRVEPVSQPDAEWLRQHFEPCNQMVHQSGKFCFALQAAVDWRFAKEPRSSVARIWGGIEALLGVESELVYRVSLLSACLLRPRGHERKLKFREVKKLYGLRSKVVHGEPLDEQQILQALGDSFHLLRDLLIVCITNRRELSSADLDDAVFS